MKLIQIVLNPAESKKLISDALFRMGCVQKAFKKGILAIHPSSTVYFLYEHLTGSLPSEGWIFGMVSKDGLCRSKYVAESLNTGKSARKLWVFREGVLSDPVPLDAVLQEMGPGDVFIKGCNAIDSYGNAAVLSSSPDKGGTTGKIIRAKAERGFKFIVPAGAEKSIPGRLSEVYDFCGKDKADAGGGLACGVFPVTGGLVVSETDAIRVLFGADAVVGAGGGVSGAEGSVIIFVRAEEEKCGEILDYFASIKGVEIPYAEYVTYN